MVITTGDSMTDWTVGSVRCKNGKFIMPWLGEGENAEFKRPGVSALFRWFATRQPPPFPQPGSFPVLKPDFTAPSKGEAKVTWIGHATCLLQVGEINVLTDAVFSERCSPVQWAGPRRYVPPACEISELPPIHLVLTSHDHYDHLDWDSAKNLEKLHKPVFACGLELGSWFVDVLCAPKDRVVEMDWWERRELLDGQVKLQFLPVQHWSKRQAFGDERRTLWGGFAVEIDGFKFFFNGDTGYSPVLYEELGRRCGPFHVCAIPIGAYNPRSIMKTQHIDPDEAFLIHKHLKSHCAFGIHHATFILTDEPVREPAERITKLCQANPDSPPFYAIKHGSTITFNYLNNTHKFTE